MDREAVDAAKKCSACGEDKPRSDFYVDVRLRDGLYSKCKTCHYRATQRWQRNNRSRLNERERERYHSGGKERKRWAKIQAKYGIARAEYERLLIAQGNVCAICGKPFVEDCSTGGHWDIASVDHNHETGRVRGILHRRCNLALELGLTEEDWERARRYLANDGVGR